MIPGNKNTFKNQQIDFEHAFFSYVTRHFVMIYDKFDNITNYLSPTFTVGGRYLTCE